MMASAAQRVNYDLIGHLYDEPGRDYDVDPRLAKFMEGKAGRGFCVLDMGCGTGKQLAADHGRFPELPKVGLDLYYGMLNQASRRCADIAWVQGDSAATPFDANCFGYITNQFSYHHVQEKQRMFSETYRILEPGGRFVITNLDPWSMADWIVYTFFPASRQRDHVDFLPVNEIRLCLQETGFENIRVERQHTWKGARLDEFLIYASQRHRTSQLMVIPVEEYEKGINAIKQSIDIYGNDCRVLSEICIVWVTGDKPGPGRTDPS